MTRVNLSVLTLEAQSKLLCASRVKTDRLTLVMVNQSTDSADGGGCLKFYRPQELIWDLC